MTKQEKVFDLLNRTRLNWTVNKMPLVALPSMAHQSALQTESFGIFKNQTNEWVGTVGKAYVPYQNHEMAEHFIEATEAVGLECDRGGMLRGGNKVFLQAKISDAFVGGGRIKRWITALNSHDGSSSIGFGSSNTVVVCQNTFYRAYGDTEKVRHFANAKERIDVIIKRLRSVLFQDEQLIDSFKLMNTTSIKEELFDRLLKRCFDTDVNVKSDVSSRKLNQIIAVRDAMSKELDTNGGTLWALFNGITRYTNHVAPAKDRNDYLMVGGGYKKNMIAYATIMEWITENTAEYVPVQR